MGYLAGGPSQNVARVTVEAAATASQTIIPVPGGFVPGYCDVFVGGACLSGSKGDYDDSDGASVKLVKPMAIGTQYRVVAYNPLNALTLNPGAYVQKAGDTMTGPLAFSGAGLRILGDFSNAVVANKLIFQSSTLNGITSVAAIPNGTATNASYTVYSSKDPANSQYGYFSAEASSGVVAIGANAIGSASQPIMQFNVAGAERMRVVANGRVQINTTADTGEQLQVNGFVRSTSSNIVGAAGVYRGLWYQTNNINRIGLGVTASPESGGNVGSDFSIDRYADNGTWLGTGLTISRTSGYVTIPGQVQINSQVNLYSTGQLSPTLYLSSGGYAPGIRSNNQLSGWEFVNSAGSQIPLQITDAGQLNAKGAYFSSSANTSGAAAFRATALGGWSFADWINAPVALQLDCPSSASAYYAIRWTNWGDRHWAAISAIQNTNNSSAITFELQGAGTGWVWNFNLSQIARYDGYYCAMNAPSDYRLKTNVQELTGSLDRMLALHPVSFDWLSGGKDDGFIAHEVQDVKPAAVTGTKDGMKLNNDNEEEPDYQSVDRLKLIPDLVGAIRELKAQLDIALNRIAVLEGEAS